MWTVGDRWRAVAALADRSRRALYLYVRGQDHPVSREEAAEAQRLSRNLAAFHLDKLVEVGLLRARYQAPAGRPRGRGRTPKVYEPATGEFSVTVPERRYGLLAEILADAAADAPEHGAQVRGHAYQRGRDLGIRLRADAAARAAAEGGACGGVDPVSALECLGFEPQVQPDGRLLLANCPFGALAARHTELVCGLNHALVEGLLAGLRVTRMQARIEPAPPACCVQLHDRAGQGEA